MPSTERLRKRLMKKLFELFQLDQPDLDFGFYRIMRAKAREVQDFIDTDLLKIVSDAFGDVDSARKAELRTAYEQAVQTARHFGAPDPEETEPVRKARAALEAAKGTAGAEADVYDHLYRFFERYYDDGDFISRRYYTRETSGRAAPFAVPYNGEEVKLHWANADQYYIKSTDYFSNYTFDLRQARGSHDLLQRERSGDLFGAGDASPLKVHFRIVAATEGEHGDIKTSEAGKRFFILHADNPLALTETGELTVNFEYRPDPEKTSQENAWRDKRNAETVETILQHLEHMAKAGGEQGERAAEYLRLFKVSAPTGGNTGRPVLARYVNQYTGRNSMDYFIHKDLGGFLRRELDFYIKNEIMRLDDIENADAPAVESYLAKIKVLRRVAGKLIDFLAQLEDFQKKLWLKKKFVIETNYCITLDRVPEELYAEIAANAAQCEEWIKLFAIDEIRADLNSPGFSRPLTTDFLQANSKLVLDTRFFDDSFKARLLASIESFDEQCDGLLVHSENFQALNLLQARYHGQIKCLYVDPPYNSEQDRQQGKFVYKDSYENSSWISMMNDRMAVMRQIQHRESAFFVSIDENELHRIITLIENSGLKYHGVFTWRRTRTGGHLSKTFNQLNDYIVVSTTIEDMRLYGGQADEEESQPLTKTTNSSKLLIFPPQSIRFMDLDNGIIQKNVTGTGRNSVLLENSIEIIDHYNKHEAMISGPFVWTQSKLDSELSEGSTIVIKRINNLNPRFFRKPVTHKPFPSLADGNFDVGTNEDGSEILKSLFGENPEFNYSKPVRLLEKIVQAKSAFDNNCTILDYFAGSGTIGHAAINLNRKDGGKRKFILAEIGNHFDTVLKPRIAKVVYSENWKNGKPITRHTGISHCFKYIRLESYEDTLNNLRFNPNPQCEKKSEPNSPLKEDYMLRYLLDVETRGSQSLLNVDAFADPTAYTLEVKKPGTDEYATRVIDLIETFNYLLGLRVLHTTVPQTFQARFKRIVDPALPEDQRTRLAVDGRIRQSGDGPWWFRKVEGWVPGDPADPNNGQREKVLVIWRKLTAVTEQDNLMLDEWFRKNRINTRDFEFDAVYVNGSNNLPNLKLDGDNWKVRIIEEEFMKRMWNGDNA
jgi:adenine-specific DNA-methyltransferase